MAVRDLQSTLKIQSSWSPPRSIANFLSFDEIEFLKRLQSSSVEVENKKGGVQCAPHQWEKISDFLSSRIEKEIGLFDTKFVEGNFFHTKNPYILHVDGGKDPDKRPYKAILIPLSISPSGSCGTVFFKQRYIGYATNFAKGTKGFSTEFNNDLFDYKDVHFLDQAAEFDQDIHNQYLSHVPISCLQGLSVETVIDWKIGDVIIFDRTQIHCATNFKKTGVMEKSGLSLFTNSI